MMHAIDASINGIPAASFAAAKRAHIGIGQKKSNHIVIFDQLMDSNSLFLTGNTDTVYITTFLDLKKEGAIVVEVPGKKMAREYWSMFIPVTSSTLALLAPIKEKERMLPKDA